ncbi:hypothetical protein lbkm_1739 [Lachnospiraceae bacterium KM106-2]|nr:hypothetical protein lbkm_1739 [Lachnospiraceae bacterium KM106-2]
MKKKSLVLAMVLVLCLAMVTGCGGKKDALSGTTWELSGGEALGQKVSKEQLKTKIGDKEYTIDFKTGGKVSMNMGGQKGDGKYTVEDKKVTLKDNTTEYECTLDGDELSLEVSSIKLIFSKK